MSPDLSGPDGWRRGSFGSPVCRYTAGVEAPHSSRSAQSAGTSGVRAGTIWLVGMMGSGKTSVGKSLAERLERVFVDSDQEVERVAGIRIAAIFAGEGEAGFRARERAAIEAVAGAPAVVSLGGGAVAQPGIAEMLASSGTIVYLRARPETLLRRVGAGETRPLLRGMSPVARLSKIRSLLLERAKHYERAQVVIDTDLSDVETLADELAQRLGGETA